MARSVRQKQQGNVTCENLTSTREKDQLSDDNDTFKGQASIEMEMSKFVEVIRTDDCVDTEEER